MARIQFFFVSFQNIQAGLFAGSSEPTRRQRGLPRSPARLPVRRDTECQHARVHLQLPGQLELPD